MGQRGRKNKGADRAIRKTAANRLDQIAVIGTHAVAAKAKPAVKAGQDVLQTHRFLTIRGKCGQRLYSAQYLVGGETGLGRRLLAAGTKTGQERVKGFPGRGRGKAGAVDKQALDLCVGRGFDRLRPTRLAHVRSCGGA
jgi:hypothetical protein